MSLSRTEVILWAIVMTVASENCCRSVFWIKLSGAVSTEAVDLDFASFQDYSTKAHNLTLTHAPVLAVLYHCNPREFQKMIQEHVPYITVASFDKKTSNDGVLNLQSKDNYMSSSLDCVTNQHIDIRPGESSFSSFFLTSSPSW
jgi:hypothetical protein